MPKTPQLLWAQRKDKLYLTIDVQDVASPKVDLTNDGGHGKLSFRGSAGGNDYALDVTFNKEINPEESKISATARHIFMVVAKSGSGPYWPRLTKDSSKGDTHIKCDWDKWVDEDEEDADTFDVSKLGGMSNFPGFDMSSMGGMGGMMGGMGGMGGMNFEEMEGDEEEEGGLPGGKDSDDEDLPDLVQQ